MSENKKPAKMFKKIKHKKPAPKPVNVPPSMSMPNNDDMDIDALLNVEPDVIPEPIAAPVQTPSPTEDDEFERLLNEFISAELDDVEEEIENIKNGGEIGRAHV